MGSERSPQPDNHVVNISAKELAESYISSIPKQKASLVLGDVIKQYFKTEVFFTIYSGVPQNV